MSERGEREASAGSGPEASFRVEPIGVLRTPYRELAEVPRQPRLARVRARIELVAGRGLEDAIADLAGWDYVWVLTWMHRARGWRPKVDSKMRRSWRTYGCPSGSRMNIRVISVL